MLRLWSYDYARIEAGNAFKVVFKVKRYTANIDYDVIEMYPVEHEI
ncbi:hypothetical protein PAHAL_9G348600 [Panicum hallii]|jgi:hypothetical protein|uniref:Uncharacterized protein n=1 Tax=Panicum hallii TaxID=206008 RepID=A0A2T8I3H6_9POAL|nr:hypothetical protein PAHAL_9G348600 [Panicum hallii]